MVCFNKHVNIQDIEHDQLSYGDGYGDGYGYGSGNGYGSK